jgi:hypothetical protein
VGRRGIVVVVRLARPDEHGHAALVDHHGVFL